MSTASTPNHAAAIHGDAHSHNGAHDPHLAHHFDTPEQQMTSSKLGMWVFLGTEILMFGGLFCAYSIYRHNHPLVFAFGATYLSTPLGALNTIILITSSLTMAWGVRAAQLNQKKLLIGCLVLTLMGAAGFLVVKGIEYHKKWVEHVWIGPWNMYNNDYTGKDKQPMTDTASVEAKTTSTAIDPRLFVADGNAGTKDEAKIKPHFMINAGLAPQANEIQTSETVATEAELQKLSEPERFKMEESERFNKLDPFEKQYVNSFFSCYFLMTMLHGVHVLVGMGLITWLLIRALRHDFGSEYFTPVDLVGLYWHLVDLIWIFLFPLLYLIH